ncbi:MAG: tape measure protein [Roseburia sp.]|nr:tape measure protein [Roseburia sp.]
MSSMETAIALTDHASAPLYQISTAVQTVTRELELLRVVSGNAFNTSVFEAARVKLTEQLVPIEQIASATNEAAEKQEAHNGKMEKGTSLAGKLAGKVKTLVGKYANLSTVKDVLGMSDELTQTMTHLDTMVARYNEMNGTMQTTTDLSRMIYQSAQSSRTSYLGTAEAVAELGNRAQNAFSSTEEMVGFAELANKQFAIAGLSANESSAAFSQLSEAMGDGVLSGSELSGIFKQAPNLVQTLADYMGVPTSEISELASQGQITADIMKNAMFAAQDEINARFESMPMTWGQVWTMFQNGALVAFQPVLQRINELANSGELQTCVMGVMNALSGVATIALGVVDMLAAGGAWIVDNWSMIAPVIGGVVAAIAAYTLITKGATIVAKAAELATKAWTTVQTVFNTVMSMNPVGIIVLAIIALIAVIYVVVAWINKTQNTTYSATGIICGCINVVIQFFKNLGLSIANIVLGIISAVKAVGYNIQAAFHNAIFSVIAWWYDMLATALEVVEKICVALNKLPFVEIDYSGITSMADDYAAKSAEAAGNKMEYKDIGEEFDKGSSTFDTFEDGWVSNAYNSGYDWGQGVEDSISNFFGGEDAFGGIQNLANNATGFLGTDNGGYGASPDVADNIAGIAGDTANISDSLDISQENLKYLLDLAEQEAINRFTTAEIKVDMSGMQNMVNNTNDLDGIVDGLTMRVIESMEVVKEGV